MDLDTLSSKIDHFVRVFDSPFFSTVKLNTFDHFWTSRLENRTEVFIFIVQKKSAFIALERNGHFGRECVQIYIFYRAKLPSPSPLSYGMATCASRGPKIEQKYSVLSFKKKCAFTALVRNGHFGSGVCPKLSILQCKTTFAFTTLVRNGHFWASGR